jgi:hypothetical protein
MALEAAAALHIDVLYSDHPNPLVFVHGRPGDPSCPRVGRMIA